MTANGREALLYKPIEGSPRVVCTACARYCKMGPGQIGFCGVRQNIDGKLHLLVYGRIIAGHIDPIEKKPVTHYHPGSKIFSIATSGCSWACAYCFLPGTRVLTSQGHEQIQSIFARARPTGNPEVRLVGDRVALTHRGHWRAILKAFEHLYSGPILRIRPSDHPEFACTPDHRIYASIARGPVQKVRATDLKAGDLLAIPQPKNPAPLPLESLLDPRVSASESAISGRAVAGSNHEMLHLWVGKVDPKSSQASLRPSKVRPGEAREFVMAPIGTTTMEDYIGPVYNIEVAEDHSYTVNSIAVANCQNFDISQRRKPEGLEATPADVARMAVRYHVEGLAYTYNEPSIFIEYAHDIGIEAHKMGIFNIFVSNGYDTPDSVGMMKDFLDCITVDFKGSGETGFVRRYIGIPNSQPIFDTLRELKEKTDIHVEITDLIVPQVGDNLDEARKLSKFVYDLFGPDMPIHFLRWHPDYKMLDLPMTPIPTLEKHCEVAKEVGLKYVYIGNVPGHPLEHTYCPGCGRIAIKRFGFDITGWNLDKDNKCKACGYQLPIVGQLAESVREDRFRPVIW